MKCSSSYASHKTPKRPKWKWSGVLVLCHNGHNGTSFSSFEMLEGAESIGAGAATNATNPPLIFGIFM